ncbi:hypothetical protein F4824DRAFT_311539 [Ustulina deusta]|nr:hypothetical protein F4824DRAFT_311539 [Ustulina deusta]
MAECRSPTDEPNQGLQDSICCMGAESVPVSRGRSITTFLPSSPSNYPNVVSPISYQYTCSFARQTWTALYRIEAMALPTGAAIAGFVASVLSWYGLIRNCVQLVYDDYKATKSFDKSIE